MYKRPTLPFMASVSFERNLNCQPVCHSPCWKSHRWKCVHVERHLQQVLSIVLQKPIDTWLTASGSKFICAFHWHSIKMEEIDKRMARLYVTDGAGYCSVLGAWMNERASGENGCGGETFRARHFRLTRKTTGSIRLGESAPLRCLPADDSFTSEEDLMLVTVFGNRMTFSTRLKKTKIHRWPIVNQSIFWKNLF